MDEVCTTGTWTVREERREAFVAAWAEFAAWASGHAGAGTLRLAGDVHDRERFVSFGVWQGDGAVRAWKSEEEFRERIARVLQHVDEFEATELTVIATAEAGTAAGAFTTPVPAR